MFGNLKLRLLAMALMMALLVKPCLGLVTDWTFAPADAPVSITVALDQAGETPAPCERICLNGRVEEFHAIAGPVKATLAGGPAAAAPRRSIVRVAQAPPAALREGARPDVRQRLALLSRFLL